MVLFVRFQRTIYKHTNRPTPTHSTAYNTGNTARTQVAFTRFDKAQRTLVVEAMRELEVRV